jgi:hypothetical protein
MKVISFRDILICDELRHVKNEILLLHPDNDEIVKELVEQIGFDITQPISYEASKHRSLDGRVGVGFQVIGEYSRNKRYAKFLDTTDRIIVAGLSDVSLAREMNSIMGKRNTYSNEEESGVGSGNYKRDKRYYSEQELLDLGYSEDIEEDSTEYLEDDWESVMAQIEQLENIKNQIRGI